VNALEPRALFRSLSPRSIARAAVACAREDQVVAGIVLVYAALQLLVIGWDQPSAIGWENDGVAPRDFLRGVFTNLAFGQAHRYPLFHNLLLFLWCAPWLLACVVAGPWSTRAIVERVTSVAGMTGVSLLIKVAHVALGVALVLLVARIARRLFSVAAGRFAALCAITSITITYYGRASNLDGPYMVWTVLALDRVVDIFERGAPRDYALLGLFMAASVATKDQAYASYVLVVPLYLIFLPLHSPAAVARGTSHWQGLARSLRWGALGYATMAGFVVNPAGLVTRVRMLAGTNSQDWRVYARNAVGLRRNLLDLWAAQPDFHWHWGVVALCWGGVVLALVRRPTAPTQRAMRLLPFVAGLSSVLAFTLPVARCEHRFTLPIGVMLCVYGGAALAFLRERRSTWPLAAAGCIALGLSAWQCTLLALTQWGDARRQVEQELAKLPHGSLVETYGFVAAQPRFDTTASSSYRVARVGKEKPRERAHVPGTAELEARLADVTARHPDVVIVSEDVAAPFLPRAFRPGQAPSAKWLLAQTDTDALGYFRAAVRDQLPGYPLAFVARPRLPRWTRMLNATPLRIHDSVGGSVWVFRRTLDPR
jgi:hypothetical protein